MPCSEKGQDNLHELEWVAGQRGALSCRVPEGGKAQEHHWRQKAETPFSNRLSQLHGGWRDQSNSPIAVWGPGRVQSQLPALPHATDALTIAPGGSLPPRLATLVRQCNSVPALAPEVRLCSSRSRSKDSTFRSRAPRFNPADSPAGSCSYPRLCALRGRP